MSAGFDPYYTWLGIPPAEQPPDHYRLLGIPRFMADPPAIDEAAQRKVLQLRSLPLPAPLTTYVERLVEHVGLARACLMDPERRLAYDAHLRVMRGEGTVPSAPAAPPQSFTPEGYAPPQTHYGFPPVPHPAIPPQIISPAPVEKEPVPPIDYGMFTGPSLNPGGQPNPGVALEKNGKRRPPPSFIGRAIALAVPTAVTVGLLLMFPKWFGTKPQIQEENPPLAQNPTPKNPDSGKPKSKPPPNNDKPKTNPAEPSAGSGSQTPPVNDPNPRTNPYEPSIDPVPTTKPPDPEVKKPPQITPPKGPEPKKPAGPPPIPEESQVAKARKLLLELHGADIAAAKKPVEKTALGDRLLVDSAALAGQLPDLYVVLAQARDLAIDAGNPDLTARTIDRMTGAFAIDSIGERLAAFAKISEKIVQDANHKLLAELALQAANEATQSEDFERALALARIAHNAAQQTTDMRLKTAILARGKELTANQAAYQNYQAALDKLQQDWNDEEANLTVGHWLCFVKQDFALGAGNLLKSNDAALVEQVKRELAEAPDFAAQIAIADGWWDLALQRDKSPDRAAFLRRARLWYDKAVLVATGLFKVKVGKRLEELPKLLPEAVPVKPVLGPLGTALTRDKAISLLTGNYEVLTRESANNLRRIDMWTFQRENVEVTDESGTSDRFATWESVAKGKLRLVRVPLSVTIYSTNGEEISGIITSDPGEIIFQFTGRRIREVAQLSIAVTSSQQDEQADLTLYSDGGVGAPFHRSQRWALQGNKLLLHTDSINSPFPLSPDKKTFGGKLPDGRMVKGVLEWR